MPAIRRWQWLTESHQQNWSFFNCTGSGWRTQCQPFYGHSAFEANWKCEKPLYVGTSWVDQTKNMAFWTLIVNYSMQQQIISQSDCDVGWKVDFIPQRGMTSSMTGLRRRSKDFPKPNLHPKRSWSLFGGLLPVWPTTAFWILVKPLHLRSMLSKSMRYTKNGNACSQHWSTQRAQFFSTVMPDHTSYNQHLKSWRNWATKFCLIHHIHLTSCQVITTSSSVWTTFCRENTSTISRMQKMFSKSSFIPKAQIFTL